MIVLNQRQVWFFQLCHWERSLRPILNRENISGVLLMPSLVRLLCLRWEPWCIASCPANWGQYMRTEMRIILENWQHCPAGNFVESWRCCASQFFLVLMFVFAFCVLAIFLFQQNPLVSPRWTLLSFLRAHFEGKPHQTIRASTTLLSLIDDVFHGTAHLPVCMYVSIYLSIYLSLYLSIYVCM